MNIIQDTYEKMSTLVEAGDTEGARRLLLERFAALPEELQGRILALSFFDALEEEAVAVAVRNEVTNLGLDALRALELIKTELDTETQG
ncbi:MAG TPA: hypothetical protein VJL39_03680 [Candidatus Paceibacterota bacterium]